MHFLESLPKFQKELCELIEEVNVWEEGFFPQILREKEEILKGCEKRVETLKEKIQGLVLDAKEAIRATIVVEKGGLKAKCEEVYLLANVALFQVRRNARNFERVGEECKMLQGTGRTRGYANALEPISRDEHPLLAFKLGIREREFRVQTKSQYIYTGKGD